MAVVCALGYKQVGGKADGAADAAPSPSALRAEGAEAKRTPEQTKRTNGNQRRRRRGRSPLTRLANRPLIPSRRALIFTVMQVAM